jgi:hypothetical protein
MLPVLPIIEETVGSNNEVQKVSSTKLPYLSRTTTLISKDVKRASKLKKTETFQEMSQSSSSVDGPSRRASPLNGRNNIASGLKKLQLKESSREQSYHNAVNSSTLKKPPISKFLPKKQRTS